MRMVGRAKGMTLGKKKQQAKRQAKAIVDADIDTGYAIAADLSEHPVVRVTGFLSELADQPPTVAINLATIALGLIGQDRRMARTGVRMLATHGLATLAKGMIKRNVDRARPNLPSDHEDHVPTPGDRNEGPQNSFPSGHTAGAVAVARAVVREYPQAALPAYAGAAAIAVIQIPRGAHFPIDVVAGAAIGWTAEWLVARGFPDAEPVRQARAANRAAVTALAPIPLPSSPG